MFGTDPWEPCYGVYSMVHTNQRRVPTPKSLATSHPVMLSAGQGKGLAMNGKSFRSLFSATLIAVCFAQGTAVYADPPSFLAMFRKQPTANDLVLKDVHGPWLIYAYTFTGEDAEVRAQALAFELRQTLKLNAYVHAKSFDYAKELGDERVTADGRVFKVKPMNDQATKGYAVLVGEFDSIDNEAAREKLKAIKYMRPACLEKSTGDLNGDNKLESNEWVDAYRRFIWKRTDDEERKSKGPMGTAMFTKNPLLPDEFFQAPKVDDFIVSINKEAEFSLLSCTKRYTVRVATFSLSQAISLGENDPKGELSTSEKNHVIQAERAHRLASALRKQGVEAYEFHDRYGSMVTVGSFDSLGTANAEGAMVYDSQIIEVMNRFCGVKKYEQTAYGTVPVPNTLDKIPFDLEAKPIAVPRAQTRSIYAGSLFGR